MPIIDMLLLAIIFTAGFAVVSVWLSMLYFKVTRGADELTIPFKARGFVKYLPIVTMLLTFVWSFLLHTEISRDLLKGMAWFSVGLLILQVMLVLMTLLSVDCRQRARESVEGRVVHYLLIATVISASFAWKAFAWFLRLAASTRSARYNGGSPYGYHGYESYEDKSRRINGGPY
ncbi:MULTISPECIES: hypothetical protein [unclassified Methylophaga]|mgnify:FL=1|jgi:hypothetical protein|uniref:hypothetical protein n=1 Tax=unclassified Methylophaga TaxID=2629249 RepID=UPI000C95870C|nr:MULTISPECIES: hypothetical protein [unclassified Methylophaga]MAP28341.1 hypothetical protein [Methylophaga sp.]HBX60522.1 hypothetical protein [Methylophaga sp.]|tara:strand:- start:49 stop:573 length:525 start_codon:yes stop_codon:yes gene_type:complete